MAPYASILTEKRLMGLTTEYTDFWDSLPKEFFEFQCIKDFGENNDGWKEVQSPSNVLSWLITSTECRAFTRDWPDASIMILQGIKENGLA